MQLNVAKNTKRNIIYGGINKVVLLLMPFVIRTIIIQNLSAAYLGLDGLFVSILQVLNLSELGFSTAIVYSMYKPIAADDTETICALLALYKKTYRIIGLAIGSIGILLIPFLPNLIKGSYPDNVNLYILYIIYLFNTVISYLMFAYKASILIAFQREDIINNIDTISKLLLYSFQILIILLYKNYYAYVLAIPVSTIINNIITAAAARKKYPQYVCKGIVTDKVKSDIKIKVAGLMVTNLCKVSRNSFDNIFVSAFSGLIITSMYSNYFYISCAISSLTAIFSRALMAGIGNRVALNDTLTNFKEMSKLDFLYMAIGGWCSICLCCLYQPFIKLWLGEDFLFSDNTMLLFVIYFYCLKIGDIRSVYVNATGLWWENKYRAIMEAAANFFLNYFMGKFLGINGIISATIITLLIFNFLYGSRIVFNNYFGKEHYIRYVASHIKYAAVTFSIGFTTYNISLISYTGNPFVELIVRLCICFTIPFIFYLLIYRNAEIYKTTRKWIAGKIFMR